jgi:hypothetical protein
MAWLRGLTALTGLALCVSAPALAQSLDLRTGLWEVTSKRSSTGMPELPTMPAMPPEMLAQLPPAQRAQIENMMKARRNVAPGVYVQKVCITQASLDKTPDFGMSGRDADCTRTRNTRSASGWQLQEACRSGGRRQTMDIRYDVVNRETIKGSVAIAMRDGGDTIAMKHEMQGRWMGADCGDVKPAE